MTSIERANLILAVSKTLDDFRVATAELSAVTGRFGNAQSARMAEMDLEDCANALVTAWDKLQAQTGETP